MRKQLMEFAPGFSAYVGGVEEALFYYKEIFEDHTYDVADIPENAFIVDVGANVGMFTLYMKEKHPSSSILAFEPAPENFQMLRENTKLHGLGGVELHECAMGSREGTQTFTFYPNFPGNSTLVPEEKDMMRKVAHQLGSDRAAGADNMFKDPQEMPVQVQRLSHFLRRRESLVRIDLLKVDVEGAELDTLHGIDDDHWPLIRNIVVEICDLLGGQVEGLEKLLRSKGFTVRKEAAPWMPKEGKMFLFIGHRGTAGA